MITLATYTLDGGKIKTRDDFWHDYVATVQPEGAELFGRNLAAFNDALWGGPGWPGDDFVLQISSSVAFERNVGSDFIAHLREIFENSHDAKLKLL